MSTNGDLQRGPALTAENLTTFVVGAESKWKEIATFLLLPESEKKTIDEEETDDVNKLTAVFKYAIQTHPYANWRLIIRVLDRAELHEVADQIRQFAEPVEDPTLTVENATSVLLLTEKDWNGNLGIALLVPESVRLKIKEGHSDLSAQKSALAKYWIETVYNASWPMLAGVLYYTQEHAALDKCKEFLTVVPDPTLTVEALADGLADVTDWNGLGRCLRVHSSIREAIKEKFEAVEERKIAVLQEYLENHPAPSWREVSWSLYMMSGKNYFNSEVVKNHKSLKKLYDKNIVKAPATENQRILSSFRQAIETNGYLNQIVMQAILHGNAGFGKTSLIKALLGIKVNKKETSTGVLEEPKRIEISTVLVEGSSSNLKWIHIEDLQNEAVLLVREVNTDQVSYLVNSGRRGLIEGTPEMLAEDLEMFPAGMQSHPNRQTIVRQQRGALGQAKEEARHNNFHLSDMICTAVEKAKDVMKNLREDPWTLYISDVGGQLEFQEVIPALTNGPSLHFVVIAANIGLNEKCPVVYHKKQNRCTTTTERYYSSHSLKENILQQLSTIMSTGRRGQEPKILFVLTFRDKVTPKKIVEIDTELQELIDPLDLDAIEFAEEELLCHPINNTNPAEEDLLRIRKTVERIGKRYSTYRVQTPYTWLYFSIALREMNSPVLSYSECVQVGKKCGIETQEEIDDALRFLHYQVGTIRYFRDVKHLQDIVIIEPKILFSNVTRLVEDTFTFESVSKAKLKNFQKKGIFTTEPDTLRSIITGNELLTREKLLAFLEHHHILAPLEEDGSKQRYFLPCSLVHAELERDQKKTLSPVYPSLLIVFNTGYTPRGMFGFMIAELLADRSNKDNQLKLKEESIYRDQITFSFGPFVDEFRLTSFPSYIRIDVKPSNLEPQHRSQPSLNTICCIFRERIISSLDTVLKKLNYTDRALHSLAFLCTKSNPVHLAEINYDFCGKIPRSISCKIHKEEPFPLPQGYRIWFGEKVFSDRKRGAPTVDQLDAGEKKIMRSSDHVMWAMKQLSDETPNYLNQLNSGALNVQLKLSQLKQVQNALWDIRPKWRHFGSEIGIDTSTLDSIQANERNRSPEDYFYMILSEWLKKDNPPPTVQALMSALESLPLKEFIKTDLKSKLLTLAAHSSNLN